MSAVRLKWQRVGLFAVPLVIILLILAGSVCGNEREQQNGMLRLYVCLDQRGVGRCWAGRI